MLRSNKPTITMLDKAWLLWTICTINWCHLNNEKISNNNIERLFGIDAKKKFNFYREVAMETNYLKKDSITLTPRGIRVAERYEELERLIFDV